MRFFWDTNLFIYLIEKHPTYCGRVIALREECRSRGNVIVTSALTLGELIAQPLRRGRADLAEEYASLLTGAEGVELITFDVAAARQYAAIRAATSLRQPDAMQLACAAAGGAEVFISNDQALWRVKVPGIREIRGL